MTKTFVFCFWLLILTCKISVGLKKECAEKWVSCGINDRCVAPIWKCDGEDDCGNKADEMDCNVNDTYIQSCKEDQFSCEDKKLCIPMKWKCDNRKDCSDGSDEMECGNDTAHCEIRCHNGECIPFKWHCDGIDDCGDGTDEENCTTVKECPVLDGHYLCADGHCVAPENVCDGKKDCPDGGDEGKFCKSSSCANVTCAYKCNTVADVSHCYCPHGFELSKSDNKSCIDVNECKIEGFCSQMCENTNGSVKCSCVNGYELRNGTFCEAKGDEPLLIFSTTFEIRAMWMKTKTYFPVGKHDSKSFGLDYDIVTNRVLWSDLGQLVTIRSADLEFSDVRNVVSSGLLMPMDLAVDWLGRNIYITDDLLRGVIVCKLDGSFCSVLNDNVDHPRSIALDPPSGTMYWTQWGKKPAIHRQGMDGSDNVVFVANLTWPNVALDKVLNRLYWADAKEGTIECINLDGTGRKVIMKETLFTPYAISVFEDQLYWADWNTLSINTCNKFTAKNFSTLVRTPFQVGGIHIYHPVQRSSAHNPCWSSHCSHLCVLAPKGRYACVCPAGLHLSSDNMTCLPNKMAPRLYIMDEERLFQTYPDSIGDSLPLKIPITIKTISDVAYDWDNGVLFIAEMFTAIWTTNVSTYTSKRFVTEVARIDALCYDHVGENLYWSDTVKSKLQVASLDGKRSVLLEVTAFDLALNPEKGVMFVAMTSLPSHIAMYDMDGRNYREVKGTSMSMSISFNAFSGELYWSNFLDNKIMRQRIGNDDTSSSRVVGASGAVISIAVTEKEVYWTEMNNHQLLSFSLLNKGIRRINLPSINGDKFIMRHLSYIHPVTGEKPCRKSGCGQLCLITPRGHTCACSVGFVIADDNRNCVANHSSCQPTEFACKNGECVPRNKRCDRIADCEDHSDEFNCEFTCPTTDFRCNNGRCISQDWKCDGTDDCHDNSDEINCPTSVTPTTTAVASTCSSDQFSCHNGHCIHISWVCDTTKDCSKGEDELYCDNWQCPLGYKQCDSKQCIETDWWCDESNDCKDASDEANCYTKCDGFQCKDGECIDVSLICNYIKDCPHGEDENNCPVLTCSADEMRCGDGHCIPNRYVCDKFSDCVDGEDERDCNTTRGCSKLEFKCRSGQCIQNHKVCDDFNDCDDESDEYNCTKTTIVVTSCSASEYRCKSGQCIKETQLCDGKIDCLDHSDESAYCNILCGHNNGGCSHICESTPSGPKCSCYEGYELIDKVTCVDVNECEIAGYCSHNCYNNKGGFTCTCEKGYVLKHDHKTCKAKGDPPFILRTVEGLEIRRTDLHHSREYLVIKETGKHYITAIDFDARSKSTIWIDIFEGSVKSYSSNITTTIVKDLKKYKTVAYDWIASNYYLSSKKGILACSHSKKQTFCSTIIKTKYDILSLALVPEQGLMFWGSSDFSLTQSDSGKRTKPIIRRSDMDGNSIVVLVEKNVYYPIGLAVDHVLRSLYWAEPTANMIQSIGFYGENRRIVIQHGVHHPVSLSLFEDHLFWADWSYGLIMACNKFTGKIEDNLGVDHSPKSYVKIVHPVLQPTSPNRCLNKNCSHVCLLSRNSATCKCPDGYVSTGIGCNKISLVSCTSDYCYNGGKCEVVDVKRICRCLDGYDGKRCENAAVKLIQSKTSGNVIAGVVITILIAIVILASFLYWKKSKGDGSGKRVMISFRDILKSRGDKENLVSDVDEVEEQDSPSHISCEADIYSKFPASQIGRSGGDYVKWESVDADSSPNGKSSGKGTKTDSRLDDEDSSERTDSFIGFQRRI